jgi:DNA-directed RNA polymerase subunit RPC12/RpoP
MKCTCTQCGQLVSQDINPEGQNYCSYCGSLFLAPLERKVPTWMWGVVVVLMANWQILRCV